ncbi:unnamed protein product [Leptosia nina]|uniref:Uncharacterized protein n=1 Tax=Leptosia nina TaxID=320188 RepID=A0AAV1K0V8_9NEOP
MDYTFVIFLTTLLVHLVFSEELQKTNATDPKDIGREEAITFYRQSGSNLTLNKLAAPLVTNVTAENIVGLAPGNTSQPWSLMKLPRLGNSNQSVSRLQRDISIPVNITKASFVTDGGLQSISLPPLLTLNHNMSKIPVPIPNISVVSYTRANTVVRKP